MATRAKTRRDGTAGAPSVTVAIAQKATRDRVLRMLGSAGLSVRRLPAGDDLLEQLRDCTSDLVVVDRAGLAGGGLDLSRDAARLPGGLVVVSGEDDPAARARLLAAGVAEVVVPRPEGDDQAALERLRRAAAPAGPAPERAGTDTEPRLSDFLSRNPRMGEFLGMVRRVADADAALLITGETGVGKEHLARAIHTASGRARGPFLAVNCGALPENLLESELFGHERGAFTGADRRRIGHFESARSGTLFLDEIGEMPPSLQVKLLRVVQRHEVVRLGGTQPIAVDVRLIAATNRNPKAAVADGSLREDLYYRLNTVELEIPALRERPEDIPDLVGHFIHHFRQRVAGTLVRSITDRAMEAMLAYHWPGNIRELVGVIERACLLSEDNVIRLADLPERVTAAANGPDATGSAAGAGDDDPIALPANWREVPLRELRATVVANLERAYLTAQLQRAGGRIADTARRCGLRPRSLHDKMKRYGLRKEDFRP